MTKMVMLVLVLCGGIAAAGQAQDPTKSIVSSYLEIQSHLAADRFNEVKTPARSLLKDARALGPIGEPVAKAAATFEAAADLNAAREAFGALSDATIAFVQKNGSAESAADLKLAYCPMAKRSWLQREQQVRNPYYGSAMLGCGELKPLKK